MKILLDECVPWPIHKVLTDPKCTMARQRGWSGLKNCELLRLAEGEFDLFITADQNIRYQQTLAGRPIRILQLSTNNVRRVLAAAVLIQAALVASSPATFDRSKSHDRANQESPGQAALHSRSFAGIRPKHSTQS
jgi:predicted nuclease of predicted toxin-antitoxin system